MSTFISGTLTEAIEAFHNRNWFILSQGKSYVYLESPVSHKRLRVKATGPKCLLVSEVKMAPVT